MGINEIIAKKLNNPLDKQDFEEFVNLVMSGKISEKDIVGFARVLDQNDCSDQEIFDFATSLAHSGELLNCADKFDICVDKHSAGKVSDGLSMLLMSILPCFDITFARTITSKYGKHGSTKARLSALKGFHAMETEKEAAEKAKKCGAFLVEDNGQIAPASAIIYDVCKKHGMLVEPIITSTILSNKLAVGANYLIMDVKAGEGALINSDVSKKIAERVVNVGKLAGIKTVAVLTDLSWPISSSVGMSLEVQEIKDILSRSKDYNGSSLLTLAKEMVVCVLLACKKYTVRSHAAEEFDLAVSTGRAYEKFRQIVECYGGNLDMLDRTDTLIDTAVSYICATTDGYVKDIRIGSLYESMKYIIHGKHDTDESAGLVLMCSEGEKVVAGQKLAKVFYSHYNKRYFEMVNGLKYSFEISKEKQATHKLFYKVVV